MIRSYRPAALAMLVLGGCAPIQINPNEPDLPQVPTSPFPAPVVQTALRPAINTTPATPDIAWRVDAVGRKLTESNPEIGLNPRLFATGSPYAEISHRDLSTVYISEGLVRACQNETELASVLASELGRMVAERDRNVPRETRAPEPRLPIALPIGSPGNAWAADPAYFMEIAKYDREHPRSAQRKSLPPPDPGHVAGIILERAGFGRADLEAAPNIDRPTQPPSAWHPQ